MLSTIFSHLLFYLYCQSSVVYTPVFEPLVQFFQVNKLSVYDWPFIQPITVDALPKPYHFLLTQLILTQGIKDYFQRIPHILKLLYTAEDLQKHTYSRGILMAVDLNPIRDDVAIALTQQQQIKIVELGLITVNTAVLPASILQAMKSSSIPFGALLIQNAIQVESSQRSFFQIRCVPLLAKYIQCTPVTRLYGRTHTFSLKTTGEWLAQVVEILAPIANKL